MRQIRLVGSVVEDERQLDGSRHVEIGGDDADLALRLVVDRDGSVQEAELSLEVNGAYVVLGFDQSEAIGSEERLSVRLRCADGEAHVSQGEDGEFAVSVILHDSAESEG